jgi:hypothetical protein
MLRTTSDAAQQCRSTHTVKATRLVPYLTPLSVAVDTAARHSCSTILSQHNNVTHTVKVTRLVPYLTPISVAIDTAARHCPAQHCRITHMHTLTHTRTHTHSHTHTISVAIDTAARHCQARHCRITHIHTLTHTHTHAHTHAHTHTLSHTHIISVAVDVAHNTVASHIPLRPQAWCRHPHICSGRCCAQRLTQTVWPPVFSPRHRS